VSPIGVCTCGGNNDLGQLGLGQIRIANTPELVMFSSPMLLRNSIAQLENPKCVIRLKTIECGSGLFALSEAAEKKEAPPVQVSKKCAVF